MDRKKNRGPFITRGDVFAVRQYVERALNARTAQGLPAAIEDSETLNRLVRLMGTAVSSLTRGHVHSRRGAA
jgi:hypothetical protein